MKIQTNWTLTCMHSPLIYNFPFAPSVAKRGLLGHCDNGLIILAVSSAGSHTEPMNKDSRS